MERARWKIIAERYPCLTCNAAPGQPCLRPGGLVASEVHVYRSRRASADGWRDPDDSPTPRPRRFSRTEA